MIEAKFAKIQDLVTRGTFRTVLRTELLDGANMITARYIIAKKSDENKEERYKAIYVAGGYVDIMKGYLVHGAQIIQSVSAHIIIVVAAIKDLHVWVVHVRLTYLQSDKPLIRKIFISNPEPEFEYSLKSSCEFLN